MNWERFRDYNFTRKVFNIDCRTEISENVITKMNLVEQNVYSSASKI